MRMIPIVLVVVLCALFITTHAVGAEGDNANAVHEASVAVECEAAAPSASTAVGTLPLLKLPNRIEQWTSFEQNALREAVHKTGLLKVEMSEEAQQLAPVVDRILKQWFASIDYGRALADNLWLSHWYPEYNTFHGYADHYDSKSPTQHQLFYVAQRMMNDTELNPFVNISQVMRFYAIMIEEADKIFEQLWTQLELFPAEDLHTIIDEQGFFRTIGLSYYQEQTLHMNADGKAIEDGLKAHEDSGFISIVKSGGYGFQAQFENEWWNIDESDRNTAFIVNFGGVLSITTDGLYKACKHRVIPITDGDRVSIVLFNNANYDGWIYKYDADGKLYPFQTYKSHLKDIIEQAFGKDNAYNFE